MAEARESRAAKRDQERFRQMQQNEARLAAAEAEPEPEERRLSSSQSMLIQRTESREDRLAQQQAEKAAELKARMEAEVARLAAENSQMAAFVQQEEHARVGTPSPSRAAGWEANHRERAESMDKCPPPCP
jgi:hypothetical protein